MNVTYNDNEGDENEKQIFVTYNDDEDDDNEKQMIVTYNDNESDHNEKQMIVTYNDNESDHNEKQNGRGDCDGNPRVLKLRDLFREWFCIFSANTNFVNLEKREMLLFKTNH